VSAVLRREANSVLADFLREKILITRDVFTAYFCCVEHGVGYIKLGASL
jgi:hypothetical protein